jgi:multiple sugar transport system substrate-binding protein
MLKKLSLTLAVSVLMSGAADAACAYKNEVPVKAYFAAFPTWKVLSAAMAECGNFQAELDQEIRTKGAPAFAAKPSLYHLGYVHNGTIVPHLNQNSIRPLDDLVAKYGQGLKPNQLIKIDGKIMAIAVAVNLQHLLYRKDILDQLGIAVPETYDELLAAAKKIKDAGLVEHPLGATYKADWNIGIDFNNLFAGYGGKHVNPDNTPAVNSEAGVKTLEMMKKLTEYLDPEYLSADASFVQRQFQQGKIALANFWASRANNLEDKAESRVVGKIAAAAAPSAVKGGIPAVTFSWDRIAIARNITDAEAEAAFRVALEGADEETVQKNNDVAIWLVEGFKPGPLAQGAIDTVEKGAPPAPSTRWRGLIDDAIAKNVPDYLLGKKTAQETLQKIEADYAVSAREAGLLKR